MPQTSTRSRYHTWHLALMLSLLLLMTACTPISSPTPDGSPTENLVTPDAATITNTTTISATTALTATAPMTDSTSGTTSTTDLSATEQQLVAQAMELVATESGIAIAELILTKIEAIEWPDASLGCPQPDTMYTQVITPGYQITLTDSQGTVYAVHSGSQAGTPLILCTPAAGAATEQTTPAPVSLRYG